MNGLHYETGRDMPPGMQEKFAVQIVQQLTEAAPTVDAKEVVRCKDCDFCYYNSSNDTYKCKSMRGMYRTVMEDDFCSYGERRDDA